MLFAIKIFYFAFGILTVAGGIIGYVTKRSLPSLIAGSILGILLIAAALSVSGRIHLGLLLGLIASVAIAGKFIPDFLTKHTLFPAGIMALLGVVGIAFTIAAWYYPK